ncbi:MAG TPA: CPBP family intramembrane glutamic endopeptidase [Steroidobacteraceae bacterium]|nr:CPBP family intramembrane glutamic endopeptidase [Steroidobacteraceae bacterium]
MHRLLRNRHFQVFLAVYALALGALVVGGRPLADVVGALLILGLFLPLVALASTAKMPVPGQPSPRRADDGPLLLALLAWIVVFLICKGALLGALLPSDPDPRLEESLNTLLKLLAFVAVPAVVLYARGFRWAQAGRPTATAGRLWIAFVVMAAAGFAVQALMGSQFKRLLTSGYTDVELWLGGVFCFAWMTIEAGIVEEFFFRWYLQSRLAAWTRSEIAGVFLGAIVFGLAHAPGIVLRGAGAVEGLGDQPGVGTTLAYVVATQGVAGIAFGVLWARTRSFLLVIALHGFIDALSNTASFVDTWFR